MVKQLNIPLDNEDYKKIKKAKDLTGAKCWREWLLGLIEISKKENQEK